eukprot:jgi/Mesvir1/21033/Mv08081-RA.1
MDISSPPCWNCSACTFENAGGTFCEACGTSRPVQIRAGQDLDSWNCRNCTLQNEGGPECAACGAPRQNESLAKDPYALFGDYPSAAALSLPTDRSGPHVHDVIGTRLPHVGTSSLAGNDQADVRWTCQACTVENAGYLRACDVCGNPQPAHGPCTPDDAAIAATWDCIVCCFGNAGTHAFCAGCGTARYAAASGARPSGPSNPSHASSETIYAASSPTHWTCGACTLENVADQALCAACGTPSKDHATKPNGMAAHRMATASSSTSTTCDSTSFAGNATSFASDSNASIAPRVWTCRVCTCQNYYPVLICEACETPTADLEPQDAQMQAQIQAQMLADGFRDPSACPHCHQRVDVQYAMDSQCSVPLSRKDMEDFIPSDALAKVDALLCLAVKQRFMSRYIKPGTSSLSSLSPKNTPSSSPQLDQLDCCWPLFRSVLDLGQELKVLDLEGKQCQAWWQQGDCHHTPQTSGYQGGGGGGTRACASTSKGKAVQQHHSNGAHSGWDPGTGFGGSDANFSADELAAQSAAAQREKESDDRIIQGLWAVTDALGAVEADREVQRLPLHPAMCAFLCTSHVLGRCLLVLLSNDSMSDVGRRAQLYSALLTLVRTLCGYSELFGLLDRPVILVDGDASSHTVASRLSRLEMQASVFVHLREQHHRQRPGADGQRADGSVVVRLSDEKDAVLDEEEEAASILALEVKGTHDTLVSHLETWREARAHCPSALYSAARLASGTTTSSDPKGASSSASGHGKRLTSGAETVPQGPRNRHSGDGPFVWPEATRTEYKKTLQRLVYDSAPLLKGPGGSGGRLFYFHSEVSHSGGAGLGGEHTRKRTLHISKELSSLSTSLPLEVESSIFVRADEQRQDVLRALILPAPDTPYSGGAFVFDILLPPDYPHTPPKVHFLTTGGGHVRFNPNLYEDGKVCLSLLGTWSGPGWMPGLSTIQQVLVSIQSLIFTSEPYFNEPSYEVQKGTHMGNQANSDYNMSVRLNTIRHALLPAIRRPIPAQSSLLPFQDVLDAHYTIVGDELVRQLEGWLNKGGRAQWQEEMRGSLAEVKTALGGIS